MTAGPLSPTLAALADAWDAKAATLRQYGAEPQAVALERAASELRTALQAAEDEALTIDQAAQESSYSPDHIRHLLADGTLPNAGRRGAPRVLRRDLPRKAPRGAGT